MRNKKGRVIITRLFDSRSLQLLPVFIGLEVNFQDHLAQADFIAILQRVGAMSNQARTIEERAIAAATVREIKLFILQADGGVGTADTHTIARVGRHIDIGQCAGVRVTPTEDNFLLGIDEHRRRAAFDFNSQHHFVGEGRTTC